MLKPIIEGECFYREYTTDAISISGREACEGGEDLINL